MEVKLIARRCWLKQRRVLLILRKAHMATSCFANSSLAVVKHVFQVKAQANEYCGVNKVNADDASNTALSYRWQDLPVKRGQLHS